MLNTWGRGADMVKGIETFRQRMRSVPGNVQDELIIAMQKAADRIVFQMRVLNPLSDADIEINWTWGTAPKGSVTLGKVSKKASDKVGITIYASGRGFSARWFEFGTNPRFHKSGKSVGAIQAQPFFWPAYRANATGVKRSISSAVRRGFRKS